MHAEILKQKTKKMQLWVKKYTLRETLHSLQEDNLSVVLMYCPQMGGAICNNPSENLKY